MNRITKILLYMRARNSHGMVNPCAGKTFADCYTITAGMPTLWYNDAHGSTHIVQTRGKHE